MNEKQVANILVNELKNLDFIVHRHNSVTTNSIYLKLDYGVCCGIRISNHNGKKKYHYKFNVIEGYKGDKITLEILSLIFILLLNYHSYYKKYKKKNN